MMNNNFLKFFNGSFRTQLIYGFGFILSTLIILFTYVTTKYQSDFLHEDALKEAVNRSQTLALTSKVWIMANDYIGLEDVISNFAVYDDLVFAAVINMDGKVIGHSDRSLVGSYIADKERIEFLKSALIPVKKHMEKDKIILHNEKFLDIIRIIHNNNRHIGLVHLRIDQSAHQANIDETVFQGVVFTIISVLISIIFAYFVANGLIRQLLKLVSTMKKVKEGDKSVKADESGVEEISELSQEFNNLVDTLNHSEELNKRLNERLQLAFTGTQDGLWDWNIVDDTVYFSPIWKKMLGYEDDEIPNILSSWEDRVHPDDIKDVLKDIDEHIIGITDSYKNIHRMKHRDGHWMWTLDRGKVLFDDNGNAVRMVGTHTDITKDKEQELKNAHQAQIIEQTHDSVISTDMNGNIISWNAGSKRLFGYEVEEIIGKNINILYKKSDKNFFKRSVEKVLKTDEFHVDTTMLKKTDEQLSVALSLSLLRDEKGDPLSVVSYSQDITKRKIIEKELLQQKDMLEHQAHHDYLTRLPNRILFYDRVQQAIEKAKRHTTNLSVFFIDLDRFKQINDSLGHDTGDEVLKIVSKRLLSILRKEDTLARLGGDEFTVLMDDLHNAKDASILAQKILNSLIAPMHINNQTLYISCSIGISLFPLDGTNATNLLKYADAAMYNAKAKGRNNFEFYSTEMTKIAFEHVSLEASLRQALENEEFIVYYQQQIDGENDNIIGMEALVRWNHPTMGIVSPAVFIPLAEETGLIVPIDLWVMKTAMKQVVQWYKKDLNPGVLALNLAMKQLEKKDFINTLSKMLKETGCKPEWLALEVTESQIMNNPENAIILLKQISDMGIELAIDDFGTGYSSLSYLKRFSISKLKIDQSFIKDIPHDEEDVGITKAIISLAQSLKLSVIAEGVETKEQKDFLVQNGCKNIQGYFYAKPMPADEIETVLNKSV